MSGFRYWLDRDPLDNDVSKYAVPSTTERRIWFFISHYVCLPLVIGSSDLSVFLSGLRHFSLAIPSKV